MIYFNTITSAIDLKPYGRAGAGKVADAGKSVAAKGEVVELSDTAGEFKTVKEFVDALPDVRLNKVEEIKRKIKLNDYPIENNLDEALKDLISKRVIGE